MPYKQEGHTAYARSVASVGNVKLASGSGDKTVRVWAADGDGPVTDGHTMSIRKQQCVISFVGSQLHVSFFKHRFPTRPPIGLTVRARVILQLGLQ